MSVAPEEAAVPVSDAPQYRYLQEISQMIFVFAGITDPHTDVVKLVEDIVRCQVLELIIQSRRLSQRRASRFVAPEDLIFLIRTDRAKVNRLKTYLSWKDVRKNAKDSEGGEAGEEDAEALPRSKAKKIRLPWELSTMFSEHLTSGSTASAAAGIMEQEEEEDEDDVEALEDSLQRLRDADEATRRMTREEYVHYSECRQASFTFRKSKKFRDFINFAAYSDVKPNDDIIDILGFLAFEVVRELCVGAMAIKAELEGSSSAAGSSRSGAAAAASSTHEGEAREDAVAGSSSGSAGKRRLSSPDDSRGAKRRRSGSPEEACTLFTMPPVKESSLMPAHIQEAFARLQRKAPALGTGWGGRPGGLRRTRVRVI